MSKVYKALQHARTDQIRTQEDRPLSRPTIPSTPPPVLPSHLPQTSSTPSLPKLQQEMLELDQNLSHLRGHNKTSLTQFIGCQTGEGTSTIVRELARVSAKINGKSVLIIDANPNLSQFTHYGLNPSCSLEQAITEDQDIQEAIHQVRDSHIYLASLHSQERVLPTGVNTYKEEKIFTMVQNRFDSILIDSPTIHSSINALELCKYVEGVVLVIEAERTKEAVIENVQNRITQSGGKVLGLVFNKQRHYIPKWIYHWV